MITPELFGQIQKYLDGDIFSYRKIARLTGVSRGTIAAIASGKRSAMPRAKAPWDEESLTPDSPPRRCPECGGLVYMPCLECCIKKTRDKSAAARAAISDNARHSIVLFGLNLKPVHHERYEEVRRLRREQEFLYVM